MSSTESGTDVWYVSYGSNLLRERFLTYLTGGRPPRVTDGTMQRGARDPSPPTRDIAIEIPHRLYFAGTSQRWGGGGVAYVDTTGTAPIATTWARAYRISWEQFEDVVAQENGHPTKPIDRAILADDASTSDPIVAAGSYGLVLNLGSRDGIAMVTFTSPDPSSDRPLNPPALPYLSVMAAGLVRSRNLTLQTVAQHLCNHHQIASVWDPAELTAALTG